MDTINRAKNESESTFISLYKPEVQFGISTTKIEETNWQQVWGIWEKALGYGIGGRVSCGYGLADKVTGDDLYQVKLHGIGASSKLIDKTSEFRPNVFRAALRGHALRIFGGLNQNQAEDIVDELFGGIRSGKEKVGLLGMAFHQESLKSDFVNQSDVYDVTGNLIWLLLGKQENFEHRLHLKTLVEKLTQFAMLLGGFGKSWRRADHRIFYPIYTKHIIGCHWNWIDDNCNPIKSLCEATTLIEETITAAKKWMEKRGFEVKQTIATKSLTTPSISSPSQSQLNKPLPRPIKKQNQTTLETEWREAWHQENVQVWGRIAKNAKDSQVIPWLHSSKQGGTQQPQKGGYHNQPKALPNQSTSSAFKRPEKQTNGVSGRPSIYRTCLTGRLKDTAKSTDPTQIGRLWHRMYPLKNDQYLELITIFPKECREAELLIKWLNSQKEWKKVW